MDVVGRIILDTRRAVAAFKRNASMMDNVDYDLDEIGGTIINSIINGTRIPVIGRPGERDTTIINRATEELAEAIRDKIQLYRIPLRNEYGFYIFDHWKGDDMVIGFLEEDS